MRTYTEPLQELKEFQDASAALLKGQTPVQITGCIDSQKCHLIYGLGETYRTCLQSILPGNT